MARRHLEELVSTFFFENKEGADAPIRFENENFPPLSPRVAITVSKLAAFEGFELIQTPI
jgi:hypothetical protein